MKRVITVLLAVLLVLSLAACGSGVETKKLAGTWTCTIDVTDRMNAAAEQALGLSAADGAAKMPLQLVLTVTEDGAYTLRYDSDAARTALDAYAAALHPAAVESVYAAAEEQGLSREEYDAAMEKAGITMDDMVAAIFAGVDEEELLSLLTGGADFSQWQWVLREAVYDAGGNEVRAAVAINYGSFLSTILDFLIIAFAVFCLIKAINRFHRKKEAAPPPPPQPSQEEVLLAEIRDLLKERT